MIEFKRNKKTGVVEVFKDGKKTGVINDMGVKSNGNNKNRKQQSK